MEKPTARFEHEAWNVVRIAAGALVLLFAFTALYVTAFHSPSPKGFDVGIVGTQADASRLQAHLDGKAPGSFDVRAYDNEARARAALLDTDVHGVLVPRATQDELLVAQAFGAAPTETLTTALQHAAAAQKVPLAVEDLKPLPASDRRGLSSLFTVIGTLIPSLVFGVLLSVAGRRHPWHLRWAAVLAYALVAGLVVAFNVDVLVGALKGHFVGIALVAGLLALAVASGAHGLGHLGGPVGIVTAIVMLMLLGMSSMGGAVTYQLEPGFYGAISQLLPPGAALTAVRNIQYFDWAATLWPLVILGAWATGGLALGLLGERFGPHVRRRRAKAAQFNGRSLVGGTA
ncbi:MAG TPA: hypothetical protein VH817_10065 [Thermoleophilaceae bacterium]|jgi:hypothetical protein